MHYRTTHKGHKVAWDEPAPDIEDRLANQIRKTLQARRAQASKQRLKSKSAVPTKNGKPIFEIQSTIGQSMEGCFKEFRRQHYAGKGISFSEWVDKAQGLTGGRE